MCTRPHCICGGQRTSHWCLFSPFMWDPKRFELRSSGFAAASTFNHRAIPSQPMVYVFICPPKHSQPAEWRDPNQHCFSHSGHNCFPSRSLSGHPARFSALGKLTFTSCCKACDPSHTKSLKLLSLIQRETPTPTAQPPPPWPSCSSKAGKSRQLVTLILLITGELDSSENKT